MSDRENLPNLRHLNGILAVAQCGSLSAGAQRINLSQPALTQALAGIEARLGVPLFARTAQGARPTEPGRIFLERAARGLEQLRLGVQAIGAGGHLHRLVSARQLHALAAAVEHGSFVSAARRLGREPSTISRTCRDLERLLGVALFEPTSAGLRPTRQAGELARRGKLALHHVAQAFHDIADWRGDFGGRLAVGCLPLAQSALLPEALCRFAAEYPRVAVEVADGHYAGLARALKRGDLDFILGALRSDDLPAELVQTELFRDPLTLVARAGHPLLHETPLEPAHLAGYPWVAPRENAPARSHFETLHAALAPPRGVPAPIETGAHSVMVGLLLASDRITLISAAQVEREVEAGLLARLPLELSESERPIGLTMHSGGAPSLPQARFIEILQQVVAERGSGQRLCLPQA
ncbi:LysR family transcriptional regulator [Alkalilacustris brevis]|uniref:LysR family transcriptional regulator n=1 Tax=Alkalilacustris brevis TaxID=2026338 RepID=UPI000E0CCDBC|nr:LysR family transcriptional regulator [Alkalilacustris brevis]